MFGLIKSFFAGPPKLPPEEMARVKGIVDVRSPLLSSHAAPAQTLPQNFIASSPIAIFSKSYCPYCNRAKSVLSSQPGVHPDQLKVIELDHESDGPAIQQALAQREGKSSVTVPQVRVVLPSSGRSSL